MLLTPPDIKSQTLLAVPIYLLFEVGIFMSRLIVRKSKVDIKDEDEPDTDAS
jgi:sec-independent protein translocase protein TatC